MANNQEKQAEIKANQQSNEIAEKQVEKNISEELVLKARVGELFLLRESLKVQTANVERELNICLQELEEIAVKKQIQENV